MRRLTMLTVTALLLAGCTSGGSDEGQESDDGADGSGSTTAAPSATATTAAPTGPACAEVWKAGETLPDDYDTCVDDGEFGSQEVIPCDDGSKLVTFDDAFYAVTGGTIVEPDVAPLQDTDEYSAVFVDCTGE